MGFREWLAKRAGEQRRIMGMLSKEDLNGEVGNELQINIAFYGSAADAFAEYRASDVHAPHLPGIHTWSVPDPLP